MNKIQKKNLVNSLLTGYNSAEWIFFIDYSGLKANTTLAIRTELRNINAKMLVVKNKINKIALKQTKFINAETSLKNQIAVVYGSEPVEMSKIIVKYANDKNKISIIMASDGKSLYESKDINYLSNLPPLPALRTKLLGTMLACPSTLARLLKESGASLLRVMDAHSKIAN